MFLMDYGASSLHFATYKKFPSFTQPSISCTESVQQPGQVYFSCLESADCTGFVEGSPSSPGYVCSGYCAPGAANPGRYVWAVYGKTITPMPDVSLPMDVIEDSSQLLGDLVGEVGGPTLPVIIRGVDNGALSLDGTQ